MNISRILPFFLIVILLSFFIFLFFSNTVQAPTLATVSIGSTKINVEIVRTPEALMRGLSGRKSIDGGMWFVFPTDDYYGIWMKEMLFPLDIIWVGNDFKVVHVEKDVLPNSFPRVFKPAVPARYVLEVPAGFTAQYRVEIGSKIVFSEK